MPIKCISILSPKRMQKSHSRFSIPHSMEIIFKSPNSVHKMGITIESLAFLHILCRTSGSPHRTDPVSLKRNADHSSRPLPKSSGPQVPATLQGSELSLPLLVWVDDNPLNNKIGIEHAHAHGIKVRLLRDTNDAKQWFNTNLRICLINCRVN